MHYFQGSREHRPPTPGGASFVKIVKRHIYVSSYQWLGNVDRHMYAKYDQNLLCGSRVLNIFASW